MKRGRLVERSRLKERFNFSFLAKIDLNAWKGLRKDWLLWRGRPRSGVEGEVRPSILSLGCCWYSCKQTGEDG